MRPIKFRQWDSAHSKLYYWEAGEFDQSTADFWECHRQQKYEIMQFTGLTDKNGKEIYENDFIKFGINGAIEQVIWSQSGFCLLSEYHDFPWWSEHGTVIGNIYENPELMEEK